MMGILRIIRSSVMLLLCMGILTGVIYPVLITVLTQFAFPYQAAGSLIIKEGKVVGSTLIGQHFSKPEYFWGRPSATTPPYNASASGSSNWSPNNKKLKLAIQQRSQRLRKSHQGDKRKIPVDMVTASASGLDPHISAAAAEYQIGRVAKHRHMTEQRVRELVNSYTEDEFFGYGMARVNVLLINLSLDEEPPKKK